MRLTMFGELTGHLHLQLRVPALAGIIGEEAQADVDIRLVDRDKDGNPEIEVRWDLPGTAFDSGPEPRRIEIPVATFLGPLNELVAVAFEKTGAPAAVVAFVRGFLTDAEEEQLEADTVVTGLGGMVGAPA